MLFRKIFSISLCAVCLFSTTLCSCQESLEDKAEREAIEFTRRNCPTPVVNYTRTDSVTFNKSTRCYTYYCSFCDKMDDKEIIDQNKQKIKELLATSIKDSPSMKPYVQAGFRFKYVCHSDKDPKQILLTLDL